MPRRVGDMRDRTAITVFGVTGGKYFTYPIMLSKTSPMLFLRYGSGSMGSYSPILTVESILSIDFQDGLFIRFLETIFLVNYLTSSLANVSGVTHAISLRHPGHLSIDGRHFAHSKMAQISQV